jgi:hypothetical protein
MLLRFLMQQREANADRANQLMPIAAILVVGGWLLVASSSWSNTSAQLLAWVLGSMAAFFAFLAFPPDMFEFLRKYCNKFSNWLLFVGVLFMSGGAYSTLNQLIVGNVDNNTFDHASSLVMAAFYGIVAVLLAIKLWQHHRAAPQTTSAT